MNFKKDGQEKKNLVISAFLGLFLMVTLAFLFVNSYSLLKKTVLTRPAPTFTKANRQKVVLVKVIDGDTIQVRFNNKSEKIRFIGIDAPEINDCLGNEVSQTVKEKIINKNIWLESDPSQNDRDKYDRLLRYVWIDDNIDLGKFLIENGMAHEYTYDKPYKYQQQYLQSQAKSQQQKIGLWSTLCK